MLKNFNNKGADKKSSGFFTNREEDDFIIEDEEYSDGYDEAEQATIIQMIPLILEQTFNLTELLIANRVRNSEKMSDNDIYQIYRDTFKNITKVFEKP